MCSPCVTPSHLNLLRGVGFMRYNLSDYLRLINRLSRTRAAAGNVRRALPMG